MTAPGHRGEIRKALSDHGDIVSDETDGDALTALVHSEDVAELAKHPHVLSVSADSIVRAVGAGRTPQYKVAPPVTPAPVTTAARAAAPVASSTNVLRQTLGLSNVAAPGSVNGDGVVVALID